MVPPHLHATADSIQCVEETLWPWDIRHLYSTADQSFRPYIARMTAMISEARSAGWVDKYTDRPIEHDSDLYHALREVDPGELVIVDLHGWIGDRGPRLSATTSGQGVSLTDIAASSWSASAVVLTNCHGGRKQFQQELSRILARRAAVAGHFDEAMTTDFTPIDIVKSILREANGGDDAEAYNAMDVALYNRTGRRSEAWGAERLTPTA